MIAVDSSVAIAAFGEWHELHTAALATLDEVDDDTVRVCPLDELLAGPAKRRRVTVR